MINKLGSVIQAGNQTPPNLPTVENAHYYSEDVQGSPKCHDGTRTVVRSTIRSWATDTDAETLFWLHAPAGTGKSTLARTLADEFYLAKELAAGYFFKRGDKLRNSTSRIFPTIASQLVEVIPRFGRLLRDSLERSQGTIETTSLEQQFNILLRTPLSGLRPPKGRKPTKVIIIDALDEWDFHQDIHRVLKLFSSLGDLGALRLCVLFTSRFAPPIANAFGVIQRAGTRLRTLALHEEFYEETKADIEAILRDNLADIKRNAMIEKEPWPEDKEVEYVVSQATTPSPLFIYITTLIRFIAGERGLSDPVERFKTWLERCRGNESPLDHLYRTIVEDLRSEELLGKEKSTLSQILGVAVLLAVPLPAGAWAALLGMDSAKTWLRNLHAVISVPADDQAPVEIIHKSFSDFLLGNELPDTNPFKVDVSETHHMLARRCMVRSSEGLRKNICKLDSPAMSKHDILEGTIAKCIPNDLEQLLKVALWQESQPRASSPLSEFLKDAERFVLEYGSMIERNPLQAYGSALNVKGVPTDWGPQLQTFMAGDDFEAFAISQDGQMMAVATLSTLELWDVGTGILQQEFTETGRSYALRRQIGSV
ncbi:hypothetical protein CEP51_010758 [Fusarium floridanum]|uniref:Nephrocystin 3-like N-terminal domain-containing protein n=1 Tax=Fusarium floridanum TaxID=1325733 RepID=A0A428RDG4_9HYPO|nr:hypothetical protein CEP51_010758 [Fusarium floridanum]